MGDSSEVAQRVANRYLRALLPPEPQVVPSQPVKPPAPPASDSPFEYERPHVPHPDQEGLTNIFKTLPWWGGPKHDAPNPERAEEEYSEESTFDSPEYSPGARGYKGQFKAFREKFKDAEWPNPMPEGSYVGWQPKVQVDTLIDWTGGKGSTDPGTAHRMQRVSARIVRSLFRAFRRAQTTR